MKNYFRESGVPQNVRFVTTSAADDFIAPPGVGKSLVILDVVTYGDANFMQVAAGDYVVPPGASAAAGCASCTNYAGVVFLFAPAGANHYTGGIKLQENVGIQSATGGAKMTVVYYIDGE